MGATSGPDDVGKVRGVDTSPVPDIACRIATVRSLGAP